MAIFDFNKHQRVSDLEQVDRQFRKFYVEDEESGEFVIGEDFQEAANSWTKMLRNLENERNKKKPDADISELSEYGETIEAVAKYITDLKTQNTELSSKANINPEKIRQEASAEWQRKYEALKSQSDERNSKLTTKINQMMVEQPLLALAAKSGGSPVAWKGMNAFLRVEETEDGDFKTVIVDADGDIEYGSSGSPMTFDEWSQKLSKSPDYQFLFPSKQASGTGHQNGTGNGRGPGKPKVDIDSLSPSQLIRLGLENPENYVTSSGQKAASNG